MTPAPLDYRPQPARRLPLKPADWIVLVAAVLTVTSFFRVIEVPITCSNSNEDYTYLAINRGVVYLSLTTKLDLRPELRLTDSWGWPHREAGDWHRVAIRPRRPGLWMLLCPLPLLAAVPIAWLYVARRRARR